MYPRFFNLREHPFSPTPDPKFFFLTDQHRRALAGISYAIFSGKRFAVLSGDIGMGKTTVLNTALRHLPTSRCQSSFIFNPTLAAGEVVEAVLLGFGVTEIPASKGQQLRLLGEVLQHGSDRGKVSAVVIDEAHRISPEVLEEIRLLGNFESLQIVLAGQNELNETLNREDLRQLKQRIAVRFSIEPLSPEEVGQYIRHRWAKAGGKAPAFSPPAFEEVARWSGGNPRLINSVCDNSLMAAFEEQVAVVTTRHVFGSGRQAADCRSKSQRRHRRTRGSS